MKKSELRHMIKEAYSWDGLDNKTNFEAISDELSKKIIMKKEAILNWLNKNYKNVNEFNGIMEKQKGKREQGVFDYIKSSILNDKKIKESFNMKKSELREMIREEIQKTNRVLNESPDELLKKIGDIAKNSDLMDMRRDLEKIFKKKDIDFVLSPRAMYRINAGGKTIMIINKRYVSNPDLTVGDIAIGYA